MICFENASTHFFVFFCCIFNTKSPTPMSVLNIMQDCIFSSDIEGLRKCSTYFLTTSADNVKKQTFAPIFLIFF